jgi:4-diphosphocytidyl-2C-methyl-D-erythritol kinase
VGWRMTGSGTAFFKACPDRRQAEREVRALDCWSAVVTAVPSWAPMAS